MSFYGRRKGILDFDRVESAPVWGATPSAAGMALQWAARRTPDLRPEATTRDTSRARAMLARFCEIRVPIRAISFADDKFATDVGTRRLLAVYSGVVARYECVEPSTRGLPSIGHFGFFRREAKEGLWPSVLADVLAVLSKTPVPSVRH